MNCLAFSWRSWFSTIHDTLPRSSISGPATTGITSNPPCRHHDSAVESYVHGIANDLLPTRLKLGGLHESQGDSISNQAVRVRSTEGRYLTGTTDADGYTQWVERDASEALAFDLVQDS